MTTVAPVLLTRPAAARTTGSSRLLEPVEQPCLGLSGILEVPGVPTGGSALDLRSGQRGRDHDRDAAGPLPAFGEELLELRHGLLRLDLHGSNIDQRNVLIGPTAQAHVRFVTGLAEVGDVGRAEEAAHRHTNEAGDFIDVEDESCGHASRVDFEGYRNLEASDRFYFRALGGWQ